MYKDQTNKIVGHIPEPPQFVDSRPKNCMSTILERMQAHELEQAKQEQRERHAIIETAENTEKMKNDLETVIHNQDAQIKLLEDMLHLQEEQLQVLKNIFSSLKSVEKL